MFSQFMLKSKLRFASCITVVAVLAASFLVSILYTYLIPRDLLTELVISCILTIIVGFPISWYIGSISIKSHNLSIELGRNRARLEILSEINADWFWELDENLKFSFFNEAFEDVTGTSPNRLLGKSFEEIEIGDVEQDCLAQQLDTLTSNRSFRDFTYSNHTLNRGTLWLSLSGNPVFDDSGGFAGYLGVGRDITERVEHQKELETARASAFAADRAKSEFLANMSHEIRTPMNGIMGMAELLIKTELTEKQKTFSSIIVKSGAALLTIINDILDFSKIEAGQMELDPLPFNLAEAIEDVATLVSAKVSEKDLELAIRINPDLPQMFVGDVGRIRQIITNLLGNAVKFTENGHVYLNVDGDPMANEYIRLRFTIEDTGIGIPPEKCDRIFGKFSQVDGSATRKHEGTGLGLAITTSLVEMMDGKIELASEVNKGSVFTFEIVLPAHGMKKPRNDIPVDVSGAHILLVDDNKINRSILTENLSSWNFDSAAASSGEEAVAFLNAAFANDVKIDCAILDYHMPNMNGGELARFMADDDRYNDIPIIMLTSVDEMEDGLKFSSLGVQGHLVKPRSSFSFAGYYFARVAGES